MLFPREMASFSRTGCVVEVQRDLECLRWAQDKKKGGQRDAILDGHCWWRSNLGWHEVGSGSHISTGFWSAIHSSLALCSQDKWRYQSSNTAKLGDIWSTVGPSKKANCWYFSCWQNPKQLNGSVRSTGFLLGLPKVHESRVENHRNTLCHVFANKYGKCMQVRRISN